MKIIKETGLIEDVQFLASPNHDDRPDQMSMDLIVIHNISLPPEQFGSDHINQLFTNCLCPDEHPFFAEINHLKVSSHVLIRRDGEIIQYVPFHKRAWHAGASSFKGREVCNDFSIGIELEGTDNQSFCDEQYEALDNLLSELLVTYPTLSAEAITGHEHISPGRKTDPGPYFEWKKLSDALDVSLPADANCKA
ncbi:1,6-anhydro-N-acetylmuramyl-L-alanine amidase AmpD [Leucothrix sargassi]|nr:1,6-anhydro-N-acetylmuramyl-L-alanine amidase AmpD [Leucothrix sargassi]